MDLQMEMVTNEIRKFAKKYEERLLHVNVEEIQLLDKSEIVRRLERKTPFELMKWSLKAEHSEVHHKYN